MDWLAAGTKAGDYKYPNYGFWFHLRIELNSFAECKKIKSELFAEHFSLSQIQWAA
jgi:hypothetical protein